MAETHAASHHVTGHFECEGEEKRGGGGGAAFEVGLRLTADGKRLLVLIIV